MPDGTGLVLDRIQPELKYRLLHVIAAIEQQSHAAGMAREEREIPCLLGLDPRRAQRGRAALRPLPPFNAC